MCIIVIIMTQTDIVGLGKRKREVSKMKRLKVGHVVMVIVIAWLLILLPYFVPALNVSTRILGIPLTMWLAIIAFAMCLVVNAFAVRGTWETFDDDDSTYDSEGVS